MVDDYKAMVSSRHSRAGGHRLSDCVKHAQDLCQPRSKSQYGTVGGAQEVSPLAEELLAIESFQKRNGLFSLKV